GSHLSGSAVPFPTWFLSPSLVTTTADAPVNLSDSVLLSMPVPLPYQSSFDDWLLRRHWICLLRLTLLYRTSATHHSPLYDWVMNVGHVD
ncbi:hypothetical protein HN51_066913, partial [Arachis hypogaea]